MTAAIAFHIDSLPFRNLRLLLLIGQPLVLCLQHTDLALAGCEVHEIRFSLAQQVSIRDAGRASRPATWPACQAVRRRLPAWFFVQPRGFFGLVVQCRHTTHAPHGHGGLAQRSISRRSME